MDSVRIVLPPTNLTERSNHFYDSNGWLHRNANVINDKSGKAYNLTLEIVKTAEARTVLYVTSGKIKEVGQTQIGLFD